MNGPRLVVVPVTVKQAKRLVKQWHRHLDRVSVGLFAAGLTYDGELRGVAIAAQPPRVWQGTGRIVISRVAVVEVPNGCSKLYGAICSAAQTLGWLEAWTYTLAHEPGTSLRAAGFEDMGLTEWKGAGPNRRGIARAHAGPKRRWRRILRGLGASAVTAA